MPGPAGPPKKWRGKWEDFCGKGFRGVVGLNGQVVSAQTKKAGITHKKRKTYKKKQRKRRKKI